MAIPVAAGAQTPNTEKFGPISAPPGYSIHQTVDAGGRIANQTGSMAMYDTMVNEQSGPRLTGQSLELHALPSNQKPFADDLRAFVAGVGGEANSFAKLDFSKKKVYEFSGRFRRDRQYFDYDLLGNPNIPVDKTIPIGLSTTSTTGLGVPQVMQSPVWFNTVRRMSDANLTLYPLRKFSVRVAYARNTYEGPSSSPTYSLGPGDALLLQYQRNSTDDFVGALDWKALDKTRVTLEAEFVHYKNDTFYTLLPSLLNLQEADGTRVTLGAWDSLEPVGWAASAGTMAFTLSSLCSTGSMGAGNYTASPLSYIVLTANANGLPIINPACSVIRSYLRRQPSRTLTPNGAIRFQSSSIRNVEMNGDVRYSRATMNLPSYFDQFQGLKASASSGVLSSTWAGLAAASRESFSTDYGVIWQAGKKVSLADQASFNTFHQPGWATVTSAVSTTITTAGAVSINSIANATAAASIWGGGPSAVNTPASGYLGQESFTNNLTASWDPMASLRFSLTYHYGNRTVAQGTPHNIPIPNCYAYNSTLTTECQSPYNDPVNGTITINENGGVFHAVVRPTSNLDVNGSIGFTYDDNVITAVSPRQTWQYKIRAKYKPTSWAVLSAAYTDRERHNNTSNNLAMDNQSSYGYASVQLASASLNHQDYSRNFSLSGSMQKNERYGLEFFYAFTQTFSTTNICYDAVNSTYAGYLPGALPGATGVSCYTGVGHSSGSPPPTPTQFTVLAADFEKAPTNFGSLSLMAAPVKNIRTNVGLRISSVNGSRFFNDARDVNGSIISTYQSPFANVAWTMRPGLIWKAEYNYFGYGEGGPGGAQYCTLTNPATNGPTSISATPCSSIANSELTVAGENAAGATAPRNFHSNNVALGVHYEF